MLDTRYLRLRGQVTIRIIVITIAAYLARVAIWPVLLYRRARYGYAFRRIRMAQPRYAKVDPADYKRLRKYQWFATKGTNCFYTRGCVANSKTGKEKLVYIHQMIIEVPEGMVVDHINHDGMDNRSANLRAATRAQNTRNRKKFAKSSGSKYKGIYFRKKTRKWEVLITFEKKKIHLGTFPNEIEAAKAYDRAAVKYHGEFACLNFPNND